MKFCMNGKLYDTETSTFLGRSPWRCWDSNEHGAGPEIQYSYYQSPGDRIFRVEEAKAYKFSIFFPAEKPHFNFYTDIKERMLDDIHEHGVDISNMAEKA